MKMLNKETGSSDAMCGNASNVQERDTAASQIKATGRSWREQWDDPNETGPSLLSSEKQRWEALAEAISAGPWQG